MSFTKFPNDLFSLMPLMSANSWRLFTYLYSQTGGWNGGKGRRVAITWDALQQATGIGGRETLNRAIKDVAKFGIVCKDGEWVYSTKMVLSQYQNGTKPVPKQNRVGTKTEPPTSGLKKKKEKKEKKEKDDDVKTPSQTFTELTGFTPPHPSLSNRTRDWLEPIARYLELTGGDVEAVNVLICDAIELARNKGYNIVSPRSLMRIIERMAGERKPRQENPHAVMVWDKAMGAIRANTRPELPDGDINKLRPFWQDMKTANNGQLARLRQRFINSFSEV